MGIYKQRTSNIWWCRFRVDVIRSGLARCGSLILLGTTVLTLTSCGEYRTTAGGIEVQIEPGAGYPGDEWVDRTWSAVNAVLGGLDDTQDLTRVTFTPSWVECGEIKDAAGCYISGAIRVVRVTDDPCHGDTLAHEFVHHWEAVTGRDANHEAWWFKERLPVALEALGLVCEDAGLGQ